LIIVIISNGTLNIRSPIVTTHILQWVIKRVEIGDHFRQKPSITIAKPQLTIPSTPTHPDSTIR